MLSLTRKTDYALVAMAELARRSPMCLSARRIAEVLNLPLPVLTNVLNQLLHHGLVTSVRGARGGYQLARAATEITLADLIEAIEGPVRLALCCSTEADWPVEAERCGLEVSCRVKAPLRRVHENLLSFLRRISLAELAMEPAVPLRFEESAGRSREEPSGICVPSTGEAGSVAGGSVYQLE